METKHEVLSAWAQAVSPSPTLAVDAKAKALKAAGEDVCGFGAGEPDFDTPDFIKEAAKRALDDGKTKYIPAPGLPDLREAIADKYRSHNRVGYVQSKNVVVSPGGKYSCHLALWATCGFGDEVLIPAPYWVSYPEMVKLCGAIPKFIETDDSTQFKMTPEQLKAAITPKTKLLIFNSPSNPTGVAYTRQEIEALMAVVLEAGILVMSDEIYEHLLYDDTEHVSPASLSEELAQQVITVSGFSKSYSMTGWRLGTLVAPDSIAKAVSSIQSHTTSNATTFAQFGALAALTEAEKTAAVLKDWLVTFDRRRERLLQGLAAIPGVTCARPNGAFYVFPNISGLGMTSTDFAANLLDEEKVALVPGIAFGADNYVRLSYATSDEIIEKGLERLERFCQAKANAV